MIISDPPKMDEYGEYCINCYTPRPNQITQDGMKMFVCHVCGQTHERMLIIDPDIKSWIDDENRYYHESVGIVLVNPDKKMLFYELTKFPYGYTIPAGHVDVDEEPADAVMRETLEEVGITIQSPRRIAHVMIGGDSCRRGCDDHLWSLYVQHLSTDEIKTLSVDEHEGKKSTWVHIQDVKSLKLASAVKFLFTKYKQDIESAL